MKKSLTLILILVLAIVAASAQVVALGPLIAYDGSSRTVGDNSASRGSLTLGAILPIFLKDGLELTPELSLTFFSEKDESNTIPGYAQELSRMDFSIGLGAYWMLTKTGLFAFKSGVYGSFTLHGEETGASATAYESYSYPAASLGVPLIIDLSLNKDIALRMQQPVVYLDWGAETTETAGVKTTNGSLQFSTFYNGLMPRFSFIVKLN